MGKLTMDTVTTPSTPASGDSTLYFDQTSKTLKSVDSDGTVTEYLSTITQGNPSEQEIHVATNGSDVTGTGTHDRPYATIKHAMSQITDATSVKRYSITVATGTYNEANPITVKPYVDIQGSIGTSTIINATVTTSNMFEVAGASNFDSLTINGPTSAAAFLLTGTDINVFHAIVCIGSQTGFELNKTGCTEVFILTSSTVACTTAIKSLGVECVTIGNCAFRESGTDISVANNSTEIITSSAKIDRDKVTLPDQFTNFFGSFYDTKTGDESLVVYSELAVGRPESGKESVFGEGDSYTRGMLVFTYNTSTTVYTNRTSDVITPGDGNYVTFDGTAINNAIYTTTTLKDASNNKIKFLGSKNLITVAGVGGTYVTEYWNGSSWVTLNVMAVTSSGNYLPLEGPVTVGSFQYRYNDAVENDWVANDPMGIGEDYYWVRGRITSPPSVLPQIDQVKIHSNRTEINTDGYLEYFGKARPINQLPVIYGSFQAASNSPGNQDIFISDNLDVGMIENNFTNGVFDRTSMAFFIPLDLDTSSPIRFRISYFGTTAGTATTDWNVRWAWASPGDTIYTSSGDAPATAPNEQLISRSTAMPASSGVLQSEVFELDVSSIIVERPNAASGDILWVSIERDGNDAYGGDVVMVSITPYYTKWRDGGHINNWL